MSSPHAMDVDEQMDSSSSVASGSSANTQHQHQFQYLQQQQLSQQAYNKRLQSSINAEPMPIGIVGPQSQSQSQNSIMPGEVPASAESVNADPSLQIESFHSPSGSLHGSTDPTSSVNAFDHFQSSGSNISQLFQSRQPAQQPANANNANANPNTAGQSHYQRQNSLQQQRQHPYQMSLPRNNSSNAASYSSARSLGFPTEPPPNTFAPKSTTSETSAFFSQSSSKLLPHANEPSSVSSSYKSAVLPSIGSYTNIYSTSPYNSVSFQGQSQIHSTSVNDRQYSSAYPPQSVSFANSPGAAGGNLSRTTSEKSLFDSAGTSMGQQDAFSRSSFTRMNLPQVPAGAPSMRTSLLTSQLTQAQGDQEPSQPQGISTTSSSVTDKGIPYPVQSRSSFGSTPYSSDPRNFATTAPMVNIQQSQPPPQSTTNIKSALESNASSVASSADTLNRENLPKYDVFVEQQKQQQQLQQQLLQQQQLQQQQQQQQQTRGPEDYLSRSSSSTSLLSNRYTSANSSSRNLYSPSRQGSSTTSQRAPVDSSRTQPSSKPHGHRHKHHAHLDIANYPVPEVLPMLTALLQKIIDANDALHPQHYHNENLSVENGNKLQANVLAFHGRNIPAISLHAYLTRILKYCPTTNEVFISLLVYFDRIAQKANAGDFAQRDGQNQLFVMDSYNIHRLIIAGVTVASKFFSDIFYKNSRYAKVGGLPVEELNHLELQFLLLTDFRLMITIEELQRYADLLLRFWKKEEQAHRASESGAGVGGEGTISGTSGANDTTGNETHETDREQSHQ